MWKVNCRDYSMSPGFSQLMISMYFCSCFSFCWRHPRTSGLCVRKQRERSQAWQYQFLLSPCCKNCSLTSVTVIHECVLRQQCACISPCQGWYVIPFGNVCQFGMQLVHAVRSFCSSEFGWPSSIVVQLPPPAVICWHEISVALFWLSCSTSWVVYLLQMQVHFLVSELCTMYQDRDCCGVRVLTVINIFQGVDEIKQYGLESLIQLAASQLNDRLPEAREAARKLVLDLCTAYQKCPDAHSVTDLEAAEQPAASPWEQFCLLKLSPTTAQAVLRVTCIATR